jgi:hypothetical protein
MKKKWFLHSMLLLLVSVLLIGCGGATDISTVSTPVPPEAESAPSRPPAPPTGAAPVPEAELEPQSLAPPVEGERTATPRPQEISWERAKQHIGETATVCGTVAGTTYNSDVSGKPTFLYIGKPYPAPDRFSVIIWGENRKKFSSAPERYYLGKTICVRGVITEDKGVAQIEVKIPSQISEQQATDRRTNKR